MHINLELAEKHAIQAYSDSSIQINSINYERSLIVSRTEIITNVIINCIEELNNEFLQLLTQFNPEVVIIGHTKTGKFPSLSVMRDLAEQRIGMECMSIGAACRTYNVLLGEHRNVVAGFIL